MKGTPKMSFSFWRLKQDSTLGLRASVIRGSEAPPEFHSLPLLPTRDTHDKKLRKNKRLSVRNIVALLRLGRSYRSCFFLFKGSLHLPPAAGAFEPAAGYVCGNTVSQFNSNLKSNKKKKDIVKMSFSFWRLKQDSNL